MSRRCDLGEVVRGSVSLERLTYGLPSFPSRSWPTADRWLCYAIQLFSRSLEVVAKGPVMARSLLVLAFLSLFAGVGCQGRNGRGFHLYGNTRVPPPPTHSISKPQAYYSSNNSSTTGNREPARLSTSPGGQAIGSGVAPAQATQTGSRIQLKGMPAIDATRLSPPGTPATPRYQPITNLPAPGLQFIRRTSAEVEVSEPTSNQPAPNRSVSSSLTTLQPTGSGSTQPAGSGNWQSR